MFNQLKIKAYEALKGHENILKTRINHVEYYELQDADNIHLYIRYNPTDNRYASSSEFFDAEVIVNLNTDKMKIKLSGKGSRTNSNRHKEYIEYMITEWLKESISKMAS